ncbi:MAG: tRNA (adenosine(37)-N6)-threonylcarbamoyltransferase complex dimerization subunit type 1 TsaB [Pseudomonadota bacterium]
MRILALETSTEYCSVALWQDGVVSARCELVGQKHSEVLMAMLDGLLKEAGVTVTQLDGIAFGKGPGSFTGVRIACGVAQGLALGANLSVVGVCTLEALAQASQHDRVVAALDARMGEIYLAAYERLDAGWNTLCEPCLCKAEDAPGLVGEGWFGVGSGFAADTPASQQHAAAGSGALTRHFGKQLSGVDARAIPQASAISQLAAIQFRRGNALDAALALPLYLRNKVALTTREREAVRANPVG